jgi:hypothetical protein
MASAGAYKYLPYGKSQKTSTKNQTNSKSQTTNFKQIQNYNYQTATHLLFDFAVFDLFVI